MLVVFGEGIVPRDYNSFSRIVTQTQHVTQCVKNETQKIGSVQLTKWRAEQSSLLFKSSY